MKTLISVFTLLIVASCGISKEKSKQKELLEQTTTLDFHTEMTRKENELKNISGTDSSSNKIGLNSLKSFLETSQNFTLKNNGKCSESGEIRFVNITDFHGNKTSIPVNDNTELNFGNETKLRYEISELKQEIVNLKSENNLLQKNSEELEALKKHQTFNSKSQTTNVDVKTKKSSFSNIILIVVLSIVGWELLKFYLKKLILK